MIEKILASLADRSDDQLGRIQANAVRQLASEKPAMRRDAERVISGIETELARRLEAILAVPLSERIELAFRKRRATRAESTVIRALLDHPGSTSAELTRACGYKGKSAWHLRFGDLCKRREADLWPAPASEARDETFYSGILSDYDPEQSTFTMKPEAAVAFATVDWGASR
jgi:1,6-anhydro-N-acetylmuramate kinase